jgi:hypothetical protein
VSIIFQDLSVATMKKLKFSSPRTPLCVGWRVVWWLWAMQAGAPAASHPKMTCAMVVMLNLLVEPTR